MLWNKNDHPIMRWANFTSEHLTQIGDLELATLKVHLVIEDALRYLLATRLRMTEGLFEDLRIDFSLLAELTLRGGNPLLLGAIRALNAARNAISHHVDSPDLHS